MWRSNFDDEWERRKKYLIRSMFHDFPLTPIQEEDKSLDSSQSCARPYSPTSPLLTKRAFARPYSPLPPLIIEREPNRHDEPEEYYRKLEKKVLKVYRILFIEGKSYISDETSNSEEYTVSAADTPLDKRNIYEHIDFNNNKSDESVEMTKKTSRKRTTFENDSECSESKKSRCSDDNINTSSQETEENYTIDMDTNLNDTPHSDKSKDNTELEDEVSENHSNTPISNPNETGTEMCLVDNKVSDTSYLNSSQNTGITTELVTTSQRDHRTVTFHADVHRDADDGCMAFQSDMVVEAVHQDYDIADISENDGDGSALLESNVVPDTSHTKRTETRETELMRTLQTRAYFGSVPNEDHSVSPDINKSMPKELEPIALEEATESSYTDVENEDNTGSDNRYFDESVCEDAETQTSFNYDYYGRNNDILRGIFFGTPKVFSLCSCTDHLCS